MIEAPGTTEILGAIPLITQEQAEHLAIVSGLDGLSILTSSIIGYIGVMIMVYGALRGVIKFIEYSIFRKGHLSGIRIDLGKHLALGLEFLVGKDIIESVVHPTWDDLGKLGAIILLRTIVTIFLARELKEVKEELDIELEELKIDRERSEFKEMQAQKAR